MFRKKTIADAAAETTQTAAERGTAALEQALERITPLLEQVAEDAKHKAKDAKQSAARFAADTMDSLHPQLNDALDKVSPAVEKAQRAVQKDLLPKLSDLLHDAAENPTVAAAIDTTKDAANEVESRGKAAVAALKGELQIPQKPSKVKKFAKFAAFGALVAAAVVAVRTFLGSKDTGWAPHEPAPSYTNPGANQGGSVADKVADIKDAVVDKATEIKDAVAEKVDDAKDAVADKTNEVKNDVKDKADEVSDKASDLKDQAADKVDQAKDAVADKANEVKDDVKDQAAGAEATARHAVGSTDQKDLADAPAYGEGSYVGNEPPAGYTIKGNERSMKFHTAESGGYDRTIADVWFQNEEAAQAAGFTKAQR